MYPAGTTLGRICTENYHIPNTDITIQKGTQVLIPVLGLHRDPDYYPNPEVFDPDRFTKENKTTRPSTVYLPFGDGPRNCIGNRQNIPKVLKIYTALFFRFSFWIDAN